MKKVAAIFITLFSLIIMPSALAQPMTLQEPLPKDFAGPFSDVSGDYVNAEAITYLKDNGVVSGYPDGTYQPANEINRAEFTKIVMGALYTDLKATKDCFPDVKKDQWFAPYVCKAKETSVIAGYPDGTFKPENKITFSEASKIVANALAGGAAGGVAPDATAENWYKPYVETLQIRNAIPLSVQFFDENITRDEMAEMIYRLKDNVNDKASRSYTEINGEGFVKVDSCAQLKERFDEQSQYGYGYGELGGGGGMGEVTSVSPKSAEPPAYGDSTPSLNGGTTDYSSTLIQVAGVDEGDIIKNDGRYIYLIRGNSIRIVDAYPAQNLKELINFSMGDQSEGFYPTEMYVSGNTLTVIGSVSSPYVEPIPYIEGTTTDSKSAASYPYFGYSRTKVYVVDITDRTKPKVSRSVEFDGYYSTSRRVGNTLYMVMNQNIYYPAYYGYDQTSYAIADVSADSIVPRMKDTKIGKDEFVVPCSDIYILPKYRNLNYLIAVSIPLDDLTKNVSRSMLVGDTGTVYSSADNLYVAATDWYGGLYRQYSNYDTALYRFSLADDKIAFEAAGRIPGTVLNQFSMDENGEYFRAAMNVSTYDRNGNYSNYTGVYVLNMDLDVVGKVEDIAPGEQMYSARFSGNTGYLVTFKQIDPFFVLDMSDPVAPKVKGELKVPGYSTFLQPYDDTHVLGFGNDVDAELAAGSPDFVPYDAIKGMKMSLFDITDIAHPVELFKEVIGDRGTYSEVLYNHKALLFDKEKNLLAFPVTVYSIAETFMCSQYVYSNCPVNTCYKQCVPTSCTFENGIRICTADCDGANSCYDANASYGKPVFDGTYVYQIDLNGGFRLKGKITHYNDQDLSDLSKNGYTNYLKTISRVLYIGEYFYSISQVGVKANNLSDMIEKKFIELAGDVWNIYYGKG